MPTYLVTDSATGKKLRLTGSSPPTESELKEIFSKYERKAPEAPTWLKAAHFFMPSHFALPEEGKKMEEPEVSITKEGRAKVSVPETAEVPFLEDPITALAFGSVGGVKAAGPLAKKAATAAREAAGWFTGGATEAPTLAKAGAKGIREVVRRTKTPAEKAAVEKAAKESLKTATKEKPPVSEKEFISHPPAKEPVSPLASELPPTETEIKEFIEVREKSPFKEFLTPYTPEEMKEFSVVHKEPGIEAGYAIKPDGDIVSVFSNMKGRNLGAAMVLDAVSRGGKKLDCFDGYLVDFYRDLGFKEVKREPWNDAYAPANWNYEKYGKPDIVYLELGEKNDPLELARSYELKRNIRLGADPAAAKVLGRLHGKAAEREGAGVVRGTPRAVQGAADVSVQRVHRLGTTLYSGVDPTLIKDNLKVISQQVSRIFESVKTPSHISAGLQSAKDAMIEHHRNIRRAESTSLLLKKTVNDIVPDQERQMLMVHALEHKMKGPYWDELTPIEQGVVKWLGQEKDKLEKFIKDNKVLELMPEQENIRHIYHHWIDPETGQPFKPMYGKFSKGLPQAKQRVIPTYEEGIKLGYTPATTNPGELVGLEVEAVARAANARNLFAVLHGVAGDPNTYIRLRKGAEPQPIRMVERWDLLEKQGLTEGYVRYSSSVLDKPIVFKDPRGNTVMLKGAVGVKEELFPFVKAYIEDPQYGKLANLNFALKSSKLGLNLFHVISLGMQELANLRIPFVSIPRGLKIAKDLTPEIRLLHQEGLELYKGYEDLGYRNSFFDGGSALGKTGNAITKPIALVRDFIFNYVQPGMKSAFAHDTFAKYLPKYLENTGWTAEEAVRAWDRGTKMPKEVQDRLYQCARDTVRASDGFFSGEDWKRALLETNRWMVKMYFTPEARKWWQMLLLSPTWQREHLLVAKDVAKSFLPDSVIKKMNLREMGPIKGQYRRYALGGLMIIASVDLMNQMNTLTMDGERKHLWENPPGKGFASRASWNEPGYYVTDKNGRRKYIPPAPAYVRPLKSLFEVAEWTNDPIKKMADKMSPVITAIGKQFFDRQRGYGPAEDIPRRAADFIFDSTIPISVDQVMRYYQGKQSLEATLLPMVGMPVSRGKERVKWQREKGQ